MTKVARPGSGAPLSQSELSLIRRERLKKLALETIDVRKDPYLARTSMGTLECRLCGTTHSTEGSYLAHSQGRKHQTGLAQRVAREQQQATVQAPVSQRKETPYRPLKTIGKPETWKIESIKENGGAVVGAEIIIHAPEIFKIFDFRIVSTYEQKVEPVDPQWQYIVFYAEPYSPIGFRVPNRPLRLTKKELAQGTVTAEFRFT